jgi:uncharacterized protein (DUF362 family)
MTLQSRRFGSVTISKVKNNADMKRLLDDPWLSSQVIIVKPNWFSPHPANFTDAKTLRILLEALDAQIVVTESYTTERQDGTMNFTVNDEQVDWRWIMKHPDWSWAKEEARWQQLRKQDKWFLDTHGFADLFNERGAEYVNVTEEVWQGKTADQNKVKEAVEARYPPVFQEQLYSYVPQKLFNLKGSAMISFGRVKGVGGTYPSLTMKNVFGMIPDPLRSWWHGPNDKHLATSIIDMNKIYASLFNLYGICEAIRFAVVDNPQGKVKAPWGNYDIAENLGVVATGRSLIQLDAVLCGLIRVNPDNVAYLCQSERIFGDIDKIQVEAAKKEAKQWFPL